MKLIDNSSLSYLWTKIKNLVSSSVSGKKNIQSAVSDPSASGTSLTFISGISQNAQGVISPSKKTVSTMTGASSSTDGASGLVPKPALGDQEKFLKADGTWDTPIDTNTWRGIQDNLTSDSSTDSLSAKQGKALKTLVDSKAASSHTHDDRYYTESEIDTKLSNKLNTSLKGTANGVAELDSTGKVPSSQLPSYVDDVLEYDSQSAFPSTGETGKIYVTKDTNKSYRWTGSAYSQIKGDLALGETSSTAYRGDRGKTAYDHSQSTHARTDATKTEASSTNGNIKINGTETTVYKHPGSGTNPHGTTKSDIGLGNVGNFKAVSTVANQGLSDTEKANARANIGAGTSSLTIGTSASTAAAGNHNHDSRYVKLDDYIPVTYIDELPFGLETGSAVVYNNEIHILGGYDGVLKHYKWNGTSWVSVSTLPFIFVNGSAVVYNNEIHILGGNDEMKYHYKWNGTSWASVSTLPYNYFSGSAVVYNNEIHILGGDNTKHYKWNGSSWVSVSTLPFNFVNGSAVVYNNEIHILGGNDGLKKHYKWDGTSWVSVSTLPYNFTYRPAIVYNNEIHIFHYTSMYHYKWDGSSWTQVSILPYDIETGSAVVYNNEIHILGGLNNKTGHYRLIDTEWTNEFTNHNHDDRYYTEAETDNLINELQTNFQAGVDDIYDAVVAKGSTPASKSLSDVIAGIGNIPSGGDKYKSVNMKQVITCVDGNTWSAKTWNGYGLIISDYIWTDGEHIYCSNWNKHYVLDISTSTWTQKTWNGLTNFYGDSVWTDGENIYYSSNSDQYVLDKSTSTWSTKTWNGLTDFNLHGRYIWTDGTNIYFSNGSNQYVLDISTSTWTQKTWNGLTNFYGGAVWTDGENIYYSNSSEQYVLDVSTSTWSTKTWSGLTNFIGKSVWTDGTNIYFSNGSKHYVLDKSTSTWSVKTWNGFTKFNGRLIWTDGENIYYSSSSDQYVLKPKKTTITYLKPLLN